jgi:hypothetical protein
MQTELNHARTPPLLSRSPLMLSRSPLMDRPQSEKSVRPVPAERNQSGGLQNPATNTPATINTMPIGMA